MKKQSVTLRVGFDLDGVLLYNPSRILRPLVTGFKRLIVKKRRLHFYYPKSPPEKLMWYLFHKSSLFISPGITEIEHLVKQGKIEAYIVTARYSFLGHELEGWIKRKKLDHIFTGVYYNKHDNQPHLFKEKMIKELGIKLYVEDNYDIVEYLDKKKSAKILWVYNLFDRGIPYPYKYPSLSQAVMTIRHETGSK